MRPPCGIPALAASPRLVFECHFTIHENTRIFDYVQGSDFVALVSTLESSVAPGGEADASPTDGGRRLCKTDSIGSLAGSK